MEFKVFDSLLDGVIVLDEKNSIQYINPIASEMVDISAKRIVGKKNFDEVFHFTQPLFTGSLKNISTVQPYKETQMTNPHGQTLTLQTTIQPIKEDDPDNNLWLIFLKDITVETRLKNKYDMEQFEKQIFKIASETDSLTQIYNRGAFEKKLDMYIKSYGQNQRALSLIFLDIDDFKALNDQHGHLAGDFVLKNIAQRIQMEGIRGKDFFARYGGEEFVVILPDCDSKNALIVGERIRYLVARHSFEYEKTPLNVTVSVGISTLSEDLHTTDSLIKSADKATYHSKTNGKNRVTLYQEGL